MTSAFKRYFQKTSLNFLLRTLAFKRPATNSIGRFINTAANFHISAKQFNMNSCKFLTLAFLPCMTYVSKENESSFSESDIEDNIAHLMILARIALEKGDTERAEAILQMGAKICDDHKIQFGIPQIYDILTTIALTEGDVEKAEGLLVTVIEKLIQQGMTENNHHIIDFKLRLARIYSSYSENDLAEIGFKTCLESQKAKIMAGDTSTRSGMLYVNIMFWYGVHMIRNERYSNAKQMLDTAYAYSNQIKGLSPYQEMVILYTLSDLNLELGEYDIALHKMQSALMLGKGISSSDLPRCYVKLSKIYMKMGVFDQAKSSAEEAAKLARIFNKIDVVEEANTIIKDLAIMSGPKSTP